MIGRARLSTHGLSGGIPIERQVYYFEGLQSIVANCQGARAPLNGFFPRRLFLLFLAPYVSSNANQTFFLCGELP